MIYCVVPKPLEQELYEKMVERYAEDENVTVIVDRRVADRRARQARAGGVDPAIRHRRVVRDRRRARAIGDMLPLATP
ncbi:MAG TPA: hypothetical protein VGP17_04220 [Solirubrobacteraceae bacterium]|jgi:hypothetical protein|nr:hypothetical protein [Solirubrobacteraceae bacterium]